MNTMAELFGEIAIVGLHLLSHHESQYPGIQYHERNLGAYAVTTKGYAAGVFENSHRSDAPWFGRQFKHYDAVNKYDVAVITGVIFGYKADPKDPIALLSFSAAKHVGPVAFRLNYAPKHPDLRFASAVWHLSLEYKLP